MSVASSEYTEASEGDLDDDYFDDYVRAISRCYYVGAVSNSVCITLPAYIGV